MLPWAHGHQLQAMGDFVAAIIARQSGCPAQLARGFGKQEAASTRLSRLLHHPRLEPRHWADAVLLQALHQLPRHGCVRLAIDWTIAGQQHVLVVSLVIGRRAVPMYGRADDASVLKGRMQRDEHAVMHRVLRRVGQAAGKRRVRVTADRGFADVALFDGLKELGVAFLTRVKRNTMVCQDGIWRHLSTVRFAGNSRHRSFGCVLSCRRAPHAVGLPMRRARATKGNWEMLVRIQMLYIQARGQTLCSDD
jgi:Transposase DDE domain